MSQSKGIDILAVNETKLDSTIKDNKVSGYDVIRKVRENNCRDGGGVCIYVRTNISFECLTIEIKKPRSTPFPLSTWYRPPHSSSDLFTVFETVIDKIDAKSLE